MIAVFSATNGKVSIKMHGESNPRVVSADPVDIAKVIQDVILASQTEVYHSASMDRASEFGFASDGDARAILEEAVDLLAS